MDQEPLLCPPGRTTDSLRFKVANSEGEGVSRVRVGLEALGELEGVSPALAITNAQGEVSVRGLCPTRLFQQDSAIRAVVEREIGGDLSASVAVEVRADSVSRIEITADAANPQTVRTDDSLRYVVTAFDANDVPVLHPVGSDEPLQLRLAIASEGHAGTLRLPGDEALGGQVLAVDAEGRLNLQFTVRSRATPADPILLAVRSLDGEVEAVTPINVSAGGPAALVLAPSGRVQAAVGGTAGTLTIQVLDGADAATANGVPGVAVSLTAAAELALDRTQGRTDAFGRFTSQILLVDRVGEHEIGVQASLGDWQVAGSLTVEGTVGNELHLRVMQDGVSVPLGNEENEDPAHEITLRAGTALSELLTFQLVNEEGGGVPGLGLSITPEVDLGQDQAAIDCATWQDAGESDEAGEIHYGLGDAQRSLVAGSQTGRCLYRVQHGNTQASALVRVVQIAGLPADDDDASLSRIGGLEPPLGNRAQAPAEWSVETAAQIRLQANDANGNPAAGLRMWVEAQNCWVSGRVFTLDEEGQAEFFATAGTDSDGACRLTARYAGELEGYVPASLELDSAGYSAPQLFALGPPNPSILRTASNATHFVMGRIGSQTWRLYERDTVGDARLADGSECEDLSRCSSAQIVELGEANEEGIRPVLRVLRDAIPLRLYQDDEDGYFTVTVPHRWMGAGRWLGLRLVANREAGAELQVSDPVPFYAQPPYHWVGPGEGGTGGELQVLPPEDGENGNVVIRGGHRVNVDGDDALELVVCGKDDRGKVFAVIDVNDDGTLPEAPVRAQRSHLWGGQAIGDSSNLRVEDACRLADLNEDGQLDLVVPGRVDDGELSAGYPNVAIHHGVGDGSFGAAHRVVWVERNLRNRPI
ncbi:MAG: hypothetical protein CMH55_11425, partial [Myxococcales bacterium]|nr:hypothetical protein [Myxococcales bacterium]